MDGNMHGNDMQMTLCILKLDIVSSIYGSFGEETGWRFMNAQSSADWVLRREFGRLNLHKVLYIRPQMVRKLFCARPLQAECTFVTLHYRKLS